MILGSGLSHLAGLVPVERSALYGDIGGMRRMGVEGHPGRLSLCRIGGNSLLLFAGRSHLYEGASGVEAGDCVACAAGLGCRRVLITHAAGSLRPDVSPGRWILPAQVIAFPWRVRACGAGSPPGASSRRVWTGPPPAALISPEFSEEIRRAGRTAGVPLHGGVLIWNPGPSYETPAEARAAVLAGADAATMSALPELEAAGRAGIEAACLSWITNYTANVGAGATDHRAVLESGPGGASKLLGILEALPKYRK